MAMSLFEPEAAQNVSVRTRHAVESFVRAVQRAEWAMGRFAALQRRARYRAQARRTFLDLEAAAVRAGLCPSFSYPGSLAELAAVAPVAGARFGLRAELESMRRRLADELG